MVSQPMPRPSCAPVWRLVGQQNYAGTVSGFLHRQDNRVSSQAGFVSSRERDMAAGRVLSAAFPNVGNIPSAGNWL
jgi:hypothetical protein